MIRHRPLRRADGGSTRALRLEELVERRGGPVSVAMPTREQMEAERARPLAEKRGLELGQGEFLGEVLGDRAAGRHLLESMLRPGAEARERVEELRERGDRRPRGGPRHPVRARRACSSSATRGISTPRTAPRSARPRSAVDLILLDPEIEVGVIRGGVIEGGRYAGTARVRRRHQPDPSLRGPHRLPLLPDPRPRLRQQDLPRDPERRRDDHREAVDRRASSGTPSVAHASYCTWSTT